MLFGEESANIGVGVFVAGEAVETDGLLSGDEDGGESEDYTRVPAGPDGPGLPCAVGENGRPGAGGGQYAGEKGTLADRSGRDIGSRGVRP